MRTELSKNIERAKRAFKHQAEPLALLHILSDYQFDFDEWCASRACFLSEKELQLIDLIIEAKEELPKETLREAKWIAHKLEAGQFSFLKTMKFLENQKKLFDGQIVSQFLKRPIICFPHPEVILELIQKEIPRKNLLELLVHQAGPSVFVKYKGFGPLQAAVAWSTVKKEAAKLELKDATAVSVLDEHLLIANTP